MTMDVVNTGHRLHGLIQGIQLATKQHEIAQISF